MTHKDRYKRTCQDCGDKISTRTLSGLLPRSVHNGARFVDHFIAGKKCRGSGMPVDLVDVQRAGARKRWGVSA